MGSLRYLWESWRRTGRQRKPTLTRRNADRRCPRPADSWARAALRWLQARLGRVWLQWDFPVIRPPLLEPLSGLVAVKGWALAAGGIEAVEVYCDGRLIGRAALGLRRGDLVRLFGHIRGAKRAGFHYVLNTRRIPNGYHQLMLVARSRSGRASRVSGLVEIDNGLTEYGRWQQQTAVTSAALGWMRRNLAHLDERPRFSIALPVLGDADVSRLEATLRSMAAQAYPDWELILGCGNAALAGACTSLPDVRGAVEQVIIEPGPSPDRAAALRACLERASGDCFSVIDAGDVLSPAALFELAYHLNQRPDADLVYSDEDTPGTFDAPAQPIFKPDWSPELLLGMNYIGRLWAARRAVLDEVGGFRDASLEAAEYDALLRLTERARHIGHVPAVLYSRRPGNSQPTTGQADAVRAALVRRGIAGRVFPGLLPGTLHARRAPVDAEDVSVISLGGGSSSESLAKSVSRPCEIICVGDEETDLPDCRFVRRPADASDAQALNLGAGAARGKYLLFLQPGVMLGVDWLEALCEQAQRPEVGCVGGQVCDAAGRILDAGLVLVPEGMGLKRIAEPVGPGGEASARVLHVPREVSAVSSACLMVRREVFHELGGFDERLGGLERDADFCLQARRQGYQIISTPHAMLRSAGEATGPNPETGSDLYAERWREVHERGDPFYGPNLSTRRECFAINEKPVVLTHAPCPLIELESVRRILAVKLDHLGDVLLALPAVRRLRELFPEAKITLLTGSWAKPLVEREACIDRVLTYDFFKANSSRSGTVLTDDECRAIEALLAPERFDLAIDFRREKETHEFLRLSRARYTAGYANRNVCDWLTVALPWDGMPPLQRPRRHVALDALRLVDMVALAARGDVVEELPVAPADERKVEALLPEYAGLLVGLHPGAGRPVKCWPPDRFARLADRFHERLGATIVIFGGPQDEPQVEALLANLRHRREAVVLAGRLGAGELLAALKRLDLFVGNDSGPTHMAAAVGAPTLGVHAATVDPAQWAPLGPAAATVHCGVMCSPCYVGKRFECPYQRTCLTSLTVEHAWAAALRVLLPKWPKVRQVKSGGMPTALRGHVETMR